MTSYLERAFSPSEYYVEGRDDFPCPACQAEEHHSHECPSCSGTVCLNCGYCPDCHEERSFCQLPEHYFKRACQHCRQQMGYADITAFVGTLTGDLIFVHQGCLPSAQEAEAVWAYQERAELAEDLLGS